MHMVSSQHENEVYVHHPRLLFEKSEIYGTRTRTGSRIGHRDQLSLPSELISNLSFIQATDKKAYMRGDLDS